MIPGRARILNIVAAVDAVREAHPELRAPLTGNRLWKVLVREGIDILRAPIRQKARASGFDGDFVITLQAGLAPKDAWKYAAHEYGHIKLHLTERGEHVRNLSPCRPGDPRELEANLFALLLALGPEHAVEHPDASRLADAIVARAIRAALPPQIRLPITTPLSPPAPPTPAGDVDRRESPLQFVLRTSRSRARRWATWGHGCSHDALRFDWSQDGRPLRFFDYTLGWLEVYDLRRDAAGRMETLRCGDAKAQVRVFVLSATDRRRYVFAEGERRSRGVKDLEQQLRTAVPNPPTQAAATPRTLPEREKQT